MKKSTEIVYLVDDDLSIRESITDLLEQEGVGVISFESAPAFLKHRRVDSAACLVLDLQMPEMSGLQLQEQLVRTSSLPIVFISGCGDVPSSVRAMKGGALEFLTKPIDSDALIEAVRAALAADRENRCQQARMSHLRGRLERLSPREREALPLIAAGFRNKQSASMMGITEVTLQVHRGQIMKKMAASTFADLVRMCGTLGIPEDHRHSASMASSSWALSRGLRNT